MNTVTRRVGGSFAPPLTDKKLAEYRKVIAAEAPEDLRATLLDLCKMVEEFGKTAESKERKLPHDCGLGHVQKLEAGEVERIWDLVPWSWEVDAMRAAVARLNLPATSPLRTPAYHLLWYAKELAEDHEPCTCDKLSC